MKKIFIALSAALVSTGAYAQDAQKAAAEAAKAITEAPQALQVVEKPKYWSESLATNVKFSQISLTNWAAGGDNTLSLNAYIDGNANWKKNEMFWNNRLQLDYGFLYASSKPLLQKTDDRIYLESKWGYNIPKAKNLAFSVKYDFKSQFSTGYDYNTPGTPEGFDKLEDVPHQELVKLWKDARRSKSGLLSPAYTNLAVGIDFKPSKWLSLSLAPLTGSVTIVRDAQFRKNYSMDRKDGITDEKVAEMEAQLSSAKESGNPLEIEAATIALGNLYKSARFALGAQVTADVAVNINDNFKYTSQLVLFSNYLDKPQNIRVNWDNTFDWKLAKYFSLTLRTNLIYDDKIIIQTPEDLEQGLPGRQRVQFKEAFLFGFTYTIASR